MAYVRETYGVGPGDETELDVRTNQHLLKGYDCVINKFWDNKPVDHDPIKVHMNWLFKKQRAKAHKRVIQVKIEAPLFDDPDPPSEFSGHCGDLYNYECVEFFFMNEKGHYLEVEVGPHGHWLVLLFDGYQNRINTGEDIEIDVENKIDCDRWICNLEIPLAYFPANVTRFNAYALHGSGDQRHYEAFGPVTDGALKEPDFHRKEYFIRFDTRSIIPEGYNRKTFIDNKYGNMWESTEEKNE